MIPSAVGTALAAKVRNEPSVRTGSEKEHPAFAARERRQAGDVKGNSVDGATLDRERDRPAGAFDGFLDREPRVRHDQIVAKLIALVGGSRVSDRRDDDALCPVSPLLYGGRALEGAEGGAVLVGGACCWG